MIDPGTAVGIASLGLQVCQGLLTYYQSCKSCGEDVQELCQSLQSTKVVLELLQDNLNKRQLDESAATAFKNEMQHCSEIYEKLQTILDKIAQGKGSEGCQRKGKSIWVQVKYPLKESLIIKLRGFLHEQKQHLNLLLGILQMWLETLLIIVIYL